MANKTGFFSRVFSRSPAAAAGAPLPQNVPKNANTQALSEALKKYVKSLRNIRTTNPFGISRIQLKNAMKGNRNAINDALQNYIMNVNKAKFMNNAAQAVLQEPNIPETEVAPVVAGAAQANNKTAAAAQQVEAAVNEHINALRSVTNANVNTNSKLNTRVQNLKNRYSQVNWTGVNNRGLTNKQREILGALRNPFWVARSNRPAPPPSGPQNSRQAATTPMNTGKRTKNNKAIYAVNAASTNYYGKKNNSSANYYRLTKNANGQYVINNVSPAYIYANFQFKQKNANQPSGGAPTTRGAALIAASQAPAIQRKPSNNLETEVKAPNGRSIVVTRANKTARWNFKNNANKAKYNLANRLANKPTVYEVNVGTGNLFKQGN